MYKCRKDPFLQRRIKVVARALIAWLEEARCKLRRGLMLRDLFGRQLSFEERLQLLDEGTMEIFYNCGWIFKNGI